MGLFRLLPEGATERKGSALQTDGEQRGREGAHVALPPAPVLPPGSPSCTSPLGCSSGEGGREDWIGHVQ